MNGRYIIFSVATFINPILIVGGMGRIKTQLIKRLTFKLLAKYKGVFKESFEDNKPLVAARLTETNKKIRNCVAGYVTRLMKSKENYF